MVNEILTSHQYWIGVGLIAVFFIVVYVAITICMAGKNDDDN